MKTRLKYLSFVPLKNTCRENSKTITFNSLGEGYCDTNSLNDSFFTRLEHTFKVVQKSLDITSFNFCVHVFVFDFFLDP